MRTGLLALLLLAGLGSNAQNITTIAGNGSGGYLSDEGPATASELWSPVGVAMLGANVYVADGRNNRIRKVTPGGAISTVAGTDDPGNSGDNGPATDASLSNPSGVATDRWGNIYFSDKYNNRVRKINDSGKVVAFAGTGQQGYMGDGAAAINAQLNAPAGLAVDTAGNVYIADAGNNCIRMVSPGGQISTVCGTGTAGFKGDNGPATTAQLNSPLSIAVDTAGNLFIADSWNYRIREVAAVTGTVTTIAGTGIAGFSGDGKVDTAAELNLPAGIVTDRGGIIYFADQGNNRIRRITPDSIITTIAGSGVEGYGGDGGPALQAELNSPYGIAIEPGRYLYVAEQQNHRIRKVALPAIPGKVVKNKPHQQSDAGLKTNPVTTPYFSSPVSTPTNMGSGRPVQTGAYNRRKNG